MEGWRDQRMDGGASEKINTKYNVGDRSMAVHWKILSTFLCLNIFIITYLGKMPKKDRQVI